MSGGILEELLAEVRAVRRELAELKTDRGTELLTMKQYASAHAIGYSTVRAAVAEGRLATEGGGGALRIARTARIAPRDRKADAPKTVAERILTLHTGGRR